MTDTRSPAPGTFTGRHMWFLILGFFGVIISVNVGMAIVASTSWTGLVVDNSYVASQEFDTKRAAQKQQQALGWKASFSYLPGIARLTIQDGTGNPIDLGNVRLQFNRPVGGHDDQVVELLPSPEGGYAAVVSLSAGVWDAWVSAAETPLGPFELHERLEVGAEP